MCGRIPICRFPSYFRRSRSGTITSAKSCSRANLVNQTVAFLNDWMICRTAHSNHSRLCLQQTPTRDQNCQQGFLNRLLIVPFLLAKDRIKYRDRQPYGELTATRRITFLSGKLNHLSISKEKKTTKFLKIKSKNTIRAPLRICGDSEMDRGFVTCNVISRFSCER